MPIFDRIADRETPIRRLAIAFENVVDEGCEGYGNITPAERSFRRTGEHAHILQLVARNEEKLTETLTDAQKETLEKFKNAVYVLPVPVAMTRRSLSFPLAMASRVLFTALR